jgi:GTP cyclohydrolase I
MDPRAILSTSFECRYDEMVVLRDVAYTSLCEHHLLPFSGTATVAYVPSERVVGISKLARLVDCYARRLQLQERLTTQVADTLVDVLEPKGVGVVIRGTHSCMTCRGVGKSGELVTSALRGLMLEPQARAELLSLARPLLH